MRSLRDRNTELQCRETRLEFQTLNLNERQAVDYITDVSLHPLIDRTNKIISSFF